MAHTQTLYEEKYVRGLVFGTSDAEFRVEDVTVLEGDGEQVAVMEPTLCPDDLARAITRVSLRFTSSIGGLHYHVFFSHHNIAASNPALKRLCPLTQIKGAAAVLNCDDTGNVYLDITSTTEKILAATAMKNCLMAIHGNPNAIQEDGVLVQDPLLLRLL